MENQIDVIVFGPHPDDAEIGAGGLIAKWSREGRRVGIIDVTGGEMSTNGTVEIRKKEAVRSHEILGTLFRENLGLPDRNIDVSKENRVLIADVLRKYRPKIVLAPYWEDRHPDHVNASKLITEAFFDAGLEKLKTSYEPYRPREILYYFLNNEAVPSFIVDISDVYERKWEAILTYESQFGSLESLKATVLNSGNFLNLINSRDRYFGSKIGVEYGEGFVLKNAIAIKDPLSLWR